MTLSQKTDKNYFKCIKRPLTATVFLIASAIVLGTAIARTHPRLRLYGVAYAVLIPAFALSGFFVQPIQAWTGFALAVATAVLAVRLPTTVGSAPEAAVAAAA